MAARGVWAQRHVRADLGMRVAIQRELAADGPLLIDEVCFRVPGPRDPVAAIPSLPCEGVVHLDLSRGLGPHTVEWLMSGNETSDSTTKTAWNRPVLGDPGFDPPSETGETASAPTPRPNAARYLSSAALDAALTADVAARLRGSDAIALTVRVPSSAWVAPLKSAFASLNDRLEIFARDGSSRTQHKAESSNDQVSEYLSTGRSVVGIANSIAMLPRSLVATADANVDVRADARVVCDAIARFVGAPLPTEQIEGLGSLDFHDIVSAFRAGSTTTEIVERLRLAARRLSSPRDDRLPRLTDAVEYGPVRAWGLALGRDFDDYRAGRIAWRDVGANAVFAGEPGLGKTYFARVLAAHLGIPLIASSISETFASSAGYLDSVIKAIRDTFSRAEASAPCALLWDEIDALPMRVSLDGRSSSWWTPVVTEFLTLLDSAVSSDRAGVCVWAATNYADRIDPALVRPGRLDRIIHFAAPAADGIAPIARHHLDGELRGVDLSGIGQLGLGRSPAEIAAAVKNGRRAARQAGRSLAYDDLVEALAPRGDIDPATLLRISSHEAGHAVTAIALGADEVVAADVIETAQSFGRTVMRRRAGIETRTTIENRVTAQLGGRAAEALLFDGDCSANSGGDGSSDLAIATRLIAALHFSSGLGGGDLAYLGDEKAAAEMMRLDARLRTAVNAELVRLHDRAIEILRRERAALDAIAQALAERRHLAGDEIRRLFAENSNPREKPESC
jgi:cell division protease FtsH